jgi:hypothetical protein
MLNQDKVSKLSDVEKKVWGEDSSPGSKYVRPVYKESYGDRWSKTRPTKTIVFWSAVALIILTIILGFTWGGWVTGGSAQRMSDDAVVQRLAPICVGQFDQDPGKALKLEELKKMSSYQRDDYVKEQGWATMPGEAQPNSKVADACAKLLILNSQ